MSNYLKYWNTDAPVFGRVPAVADLFLPHALALKLERLKMACEQTQALIALTGDPGAGKSTVLRWLGANLPTDGYEYLITTLVKRETGPGWLTPRLAELMGVRAGGMSQDQLLRATAARFDELIEEKRTLVVAVDAAQLLTGPASLEELAAFLNLQAFAGRCLTFLLCGTDSLLDTLAATAELSGKLALHTHLTAFTRDETAAYVEHRLRCARVQAAFEDQAIDLIHLRTRGVVQAVDVAADNCLTEAFQKSLRRISAETAKTAAVTLRTIERPSKLARTLDEAGDRDRSLSRMAAGDPPPLPAPHGEAPAPSPPESRSAKDQSSIKLQSLFKQDPPKPDKP